MEEIKAILSDKKQKMYGMTAPPSGLVGNSRDPDRMMRFLHVVTFHTRYMYIYIYIPYNYMRSGTILHVLTHHRCHNY